MWARRKFLETFSTLPLVGGFLGTSGALGAVAEASAVAAAGAAAKNGSDYFRDLGVKPFINASGTYTAMTASLMPPEVMDAIQYASKHFVMLDELHDRVGERIASLVKCEAAMVSSGAASAMMVGTAGVLTGMDREKVGKLPKLDGMKNEVIIQKSHRFGYDHAVRACGVTLVEVETREEMEKAITDKTAMMLFYNNNNSLGKVRDEEFVKIGKARGVPTMNDCAADVPPVENLWKYTAMGFDLVTFSGGKGIRGPQSAGMLLGRKDLVAAARLNAPPNASIGRGLKVNKEEMLGMLVALELFLKKDFEKEQKEFAARAEEIRKAATSVAGVTVEVWVPEVANHVPHIKVSLPADKKAADIVKAMREGEPSIAIRNEGEQLVMSTWMMRAGEDKVVARRLKQVLEGKA